MFFLYSLSYIIIFGKYTYLFAYVIACLTMNHLHIIAVTASLSPGILVTKLGIGVYICLRNKEGPAFVLQVSIRNNEYYMYLNISH